MAIRKLKGRSRQKLKATEADYMKPSYTVLVPWSDTPTKWHPTEKTGPFAVLTRGAFKTEKAAHAWAQRELKGQPYQIRLSVPAYPLFAERAAGSTRARAGNIAGKRRR